MTANVNEILSFVRTQWLSGLWKSLCSCCCLDAGTSFCVVTLRTSQ